MATMGVAAIKQLNVADAPEQEGVTVELPLMSADIESEPLRGFLGHPFCSQLGYDIRPILVGPGCPERPGNGHTFPDRDGQMLAPRERMPVCDGVGTAFAS